MPNQLKKNDRIPLKITGVTAEGSGVGHDNGLAGILRLRPSRFSQRGKRMATVIRHSFLLADRRKS